jgi:beta-phosphoglucomutase
MTSQCAAIFDMDGVLVDTYQAHYRSWVEMAHRRGLRVSEQQFSACFGRTSRECIAEYWGPGRYNDDEVLAMDLEKEADFRRIISSEFPGMPGARELIAALSEAGFVVAVGSSAPRENVEVVLDRLNLRDILRAVVSGSDVHRGKPNPEIFLVAAQRLGVAPVHCAVIEDAPVGLAAARAAGMVCVGFASTGRTRETLGEAQLVVNSLGELTPDVLRHLIERHRQNERSGGHEG